MNRKRTICLLSVFVCSHTIMACETDDVSTQGPSHAEERADHMISARAAEARAHVGFGAAVADAHVATFANKHHVTARAVYMWASGLTGTYRTYENLGIDELLRVARADTVKSFKTGLKRNAARARAFVNAHGQAEIAADETLASQARSLLNLSRQLEGALETASAGKALVYSVEIAGDPGSLGSLRGDPAVHAFAWSSSTSGGPGDSKRATKPDAYNEYHELMEISNLEDIQLYSALNHFAAAYGEIEQ